MRVVSAVDLAPGCVGISLLNHGGTSKWDKILLLFNTTQQSQQVHLPSGQWQILVDATSSFRWKESRTIVQAADLPPVSALILGRISP